METGSTCARPIQVQLCLRAASQGNFEDVQKQYQQLFQSPEVQTLREQPQPAWLYESLSEAIRLDDVKIVEFLLNEDVSNGEFPVEVAVRKGAYKTLSLFLDYGWDVNKPLSNNEPPILWYSSNYLLGSIFTYLYSVSLCLPLTLRWSVGCLTTVPFLTSAAIWS